MEIEFQVTRTAVGRNPRRSAPKAEPVVVTQLHPLLRAYLSDHRLSLYDVRVSELRNGIVVAVDVPSSVSLYDGA